MWLMLCQGCGRWNGHCIWKGCSILICVLGVKQIIPDVWQMVFGNGPVEGWIIHPYVKCFFNCFSKVLVFPPHYAEVVNSWWMTCHVIMVIDRKWHLRCSLNFSLNVLADSPIYSSSHPKPGTVASVDHPALLCDGISFLGVTRRVLMILPPLKCTCIPCLLQCERP